MSLIEMDQFCESANSDPEFLIAARFWNTFLKIEMEDSRYILKIQDGEWAAKIKTFQGEIIEAVCPEKVGENAAFCILQNQSGRFRMQTFNKKEVFSRHSISTFGLLIESGYQLDIKQRFFKS